MASLIYTGTASQTTAFAATDIYTLAIPTTSVTSVSQQGANVVIQTGATALTITGVTLAQLATANFALQGGGFVTFGDGTSDTLADQFGNPITGSATAGDILLGLGGGDAIAAGNGANLVYGGNGITDPNDGSDAITSGTGNDTIYGNGGDDVIGGTVAGAIAGTTALTGNSGSDVIYGGIGNDQIAQQTLTGQSSSVFGGGGFTDTVDGADIINIQNAGTLFVTGNAGTDTINVTQTAGSSSIFGGLGNDTIVVNATGAGNVLIAGGSSDADNITYNAGTVANTNATIFGGTGGTTDTVDGADTIAITSAGNTTVYANAGADTITAGLTGTSNTIIYGGIGNDSITATIAGTSATERANLTIFGGTADSDVISIAGGVNAFYNAVVYGGLGVNDAADLADTIIGGAGNEIIYGNGGNDRIITGAGNDQLFGGAGQDTFVVNGAGTKILSDVVTTGSADTVLIQGTYTFGSATVSGSTAVINGDFAGAPANDSIINVTGGVGQVVTIGVDANNNFVLGDDEARIILNTSTTVTTLTGNGGADTIIGGAGAETITGAAGDDVLNGGAGNDSIVGGTGSNTFIGGAGVDTLDSTAGTTDTFLFRVNGDSGTTSTTIPTAGIDSIVGYTLGTDVIDLDSSSDVNTTNDAALQTAVVNSFTAAGLVTGTLATNVAAAATLSAAVDLVEAAITVANGVAVFSYQGNAYVVHDDGAGNNDIVDNVIRLTGVTPTTGLAETGDTFIVS